MRRSRYTVHTTTGPRVILAYDAMGARSFYEQRGYTVERVVKGDYRREVRRAQTPRGGFVIDREALAAAVELLDLKLPVKVRFNARHGQTQGNYRFQGSYHDIMLKSYHTAEQASSTLWHELQHAQQAERAGGTFGTWASYLTIQHRHTYRNRPMEVEARALSATMADVPLCKEAAR